MKNLLRLILTTGLILFQAYSSPANGEETSIPADEAALKLAKEITSRGAQLFVQGDSGSLAAQYVDNAEIVMTTVEPFSPATIQITRGSDDIAKLYQVAPKLGQLSPVNEVHYARFITPEILHIAGVFMITDQGETKRYPFTQIRQKQGGDWKIVSLELLIKK